jgi:hypothetical protein
VRRRRRRRPRPGLRPAERERAAAEARKRSRAGPAGPWRGPNAALVPPLITILPGTEVDGKPGTFWMGSPEGVGDPTSGRGAW